MQYQYKDVVRVLQSLEIEHQDMINFIVINKVATHKLGQSEIRVLCNNLKIDILHFQKYFQPLFT
jgi:MinD superfamily P-loop ATPase